MNGTLQRWLNALARLKDTLSLRFDASALATPDALAGFVRTRSAYVAQTALYGYLKTRMGIRYPTIFQDPYFVPSIDRAKAETFVACLSDLTIFAVALISREIEAVRGREGALGGAVFAICLETTLAEGALAIDAEAEKRRFTERCANTAWPNAAIGGAAFSESPQALVRSAPIADELKVHDAQIVANSIRFRWRDVREQLRKRLDRQAVWAAFDAQR